MMSIQKLIHETEHKFGQKTKQFAFYHPYLAIISIFVGLPVFIVIAVFITTFSITLPLSLIFGWI